MRHRNTIAILTILLLASSVLTNVFGILAYRKVDGV